MRSELGKIRSIRYGFGGYQDVQFGLSVDLGGESWGVSDFWGGWGEPPSKYAEWTIEDQIKWHGETANRIADLCRKAKVRGVEELEGVPVQAFFEGMKLSSWRVLEEVL